MVSERIKVFKITLNMLFCEILYVYVHVLLQHPSSAGPIFREKLKNASL